MRVLWLSSSPALAAERLGSGEGKGLGWIAALERAIKAHCDLEVGIAFPWDVHEVRELREGNHAYYPFPRYPRGGRLQQFAFDVSCRLVPETHVSYLERAIQLFQPDLVHVWGTEPFFGLVAGRIEQPTLFELQGPRTPNTAAYLSGLSKFDLLRYGSPKRLLNGRSMLHRYFRYRRSAERERRMLSTARFVCGRTDWDRTVAAVLAPNAQYFHCNRVLRPPFYRAKWSQPKGDRAPHLVSTLRGNAYKGFETIVECSALLRRLLPHGARWTLIGVREGEEIHRLIERKFRVSFADVGIELAGLQSADLVAQRLSTADLLVHPSRADNSPNGVAEAMLVGTPVVSSNVGGIPSMITDGQDGLLVPPGDPWALAGAIQRLVEDPSLAARLGSTARKVAEQRHDPATVAKKMVSIYEEVLASSSESR